MILTTGLLSQHISKHRSRVRKKAGFSLLELIVVMLLVAMAAAITVPSLGFFSAARPLLNTADQFVALTDYARSQAITEGREYRLTVDMVNNVFQLTTRNNGIFENLYKEVGREFHLPEGVAIEQYSFPATRYETTIPGLRLPGYSTGAPEDAGAARVTFYPDGHITPAGFRLTDHRGNTVELACLSPADRFRVKSAGD